MKTRLWKYICVTSSMLTMLCAVVLFVLTTTYLSAETEYHVPEGFCFENVIEDVSWVKTESRNDFSTRFQEVDDVNITTYLGSHTDENSDNEPVDCFGLSPFLSRVFRSLFKPFAQEVIDTKFYLFTRSTRNGVELKLEPDLPEKLSGTYKSNRLTIFIIHGFMSNSAMFWVRDLTDALLLKEDVNVITVDWAGGSMSWKYWRAVANTRIVAREINLKLFSLTSTKRSQIYMIGHSLGAHIAAFASKQLGKIGRITGLDPAQPCFKSQMHSGSGLNMSDAIFVDVIHTNMGLLKTLGFGLPEAIGSVDFYPNGGILQPELESAICSHGRSYQYFIDAVRSKNCQFWGHLWDKTPSGALGTASKLCDMYSCVPMGLESPKYPGKGCFYVLTNDRTPYCYKEHLTEKTMIGWKKWTKFLTKKKRPEGADKFFF